MSKTPITSSNLVLRKLQNVRNTRFYVCQLQMTDNNELKNVKHCG